MPLATARVLESATAPLSDNAPETAKLPAMTTLPLNVAVDVTVSVELPVIPLVTVSVEERVAPEASVMVEENATAPETAKVLERRKAVLISVSPLTMEIPLSAVPRLEIDRLYAVTNPLTSAVAIATVLTVAIFFLSLLALLS